MKSIFQKKATGMETQGLLSFRKVLSVKVLLTVSMRVSG